MSQCERESPLAWLPYVAVFLVLWILVQAVDILVNHPLVLQGAQIDTDGYMRLVRVKELLATRDWFGGIIARSNWPFGESHHWTRPLDVMLIALALPLRPFMTMDAALVWAGAVISPLCNLVLCLCAAWAVRPMVPGEARFLAMPAMLMQPGLLGYGVAGRADHHALIQVFVLVATGFWMRALLRPDDWRAALLSGMACGLGIWVSPEALLPLALLLSTGTLLWLIEGEPFRSPNVQLFVGLVPVLGVALAVERPPVRWLEPAYDQVSIVHLTMAALGLAFWLAAARSSRWAGQQTGRSGGEAGRGGRLMTALIGLCLVAGALSALFPGFFRGPWAEVRPEVIERWLRHVMELQPLVPNSRADVGVFLYHMLPAFLLFPATVYWLYRDRHSGKSRLWVLWLSWLAVCLPLALAQRRFSAFTGMAFALLGVELLRQIFAWVRAIRLPLLQVSVRLGAMLGLMLGPLLVAGAASVALAASTAEAPEPTGDACSVSRLAGVLTDPAGLGARPQVIAAFLDFGPELLYRTPHRILAGPYHRNAEGITAVYQLMTERDPARARAMIAERRVTVLMLCPPADSTFFGRTPGGLYHQLLDGRPPRWAEPLDVAAAGPTAFRLFRMTAGATVQ